MTTHTQRGELRGRCESRPDGRIMLAVSGTSYRLLLTPDRPAEGLNGRMVEGRVEAAARSVKVASAGGSYVEPLIGEPRTVQGRVVEVDEDAGSLVVSAGLPVVVRLGPGADVQAFAPGQFVLAAVHSGARFVPSRSHDGA